MKHKFRQSYKMITAALDLKRQLVGVKFLHNKEEYENAATLELKVKTPYCVMVKLAAGGRAFKTTLELSKCGGGTRALGLEEPSENFKCGCEYDSFGIYKDVQVAKSVADSVTFCDHKIYGVMTMPLNMYHNVPDVVIIITNPYNAMRIIQGYTYEFGMQPNFKMAGNQAICAEATAYPYITHTINVSMLCAGTRYLAGWDNSEMAVGIPGEKFEAVAKGIFLSVNGAETNANKEKILERIAEKKLNNPSIHMNEAYFMKE